MISIIIINYKQKDFVEQCAASIYKHFTSYPFDVIIVNNSPEENLNYLKDTYPNISVIENENKGFSQANNLGAKNSKGEYLFFLNADTTIENDFLKKFIDEFSNKEFGAAGLKLLNNDNSLQLSFWNENTFLNEIQNKKAEEKFKEKDTVFIKRYEVDEIKQTDWVTGAAMIVKKNIFDKIGGFDEKFFLYYEDADLCKRLSDAGYKIYYFPFSKIIHFKGENVNKDFSGNTYFFSKQSEFLYYKKHNGFIDNLLLKVYLFFKFLFKYLFTFKKINLRILLLVLGINK